ncbi:hypothetical protein V6N12_025781 [Hibiscus sabdariffa]|uniref:Uncharacterized protein n=1 Tax=Hibiscus sabdariffa TaxID=183260 RepID=A0ABR2AVK5_9ROSI
MSTLLQMFLHALYISSRSLKYFILMMRSLCLKWLLSSSRMQQFLRNSLSSPKAEELKITNQLLNLPRCIDNCQLMIL